ncbi:ABI family, member 3 (NESH) binding protein b isoform X5 [Denticeps clupeoides]|uniref:Fibronectin type-III domain-containing protein n=1 Tax=Denticeps clupeoides TaxID=299321 RepID=A0AAY4BL07_9TELE|nr:target of Nesh-SH3-like isoform X5 [Denticeps clupeoides]
MLQHSALAITQQSKTSKLNNSSPSCEASPASRYEAMDGIALLRTSVLILAGILLFSCISAQRVRVRRQNMKVRINATGDTIVLKFLRPNPDTKLEGYILGYGSSMFSKQFIQLPENGEPYETEIDAEPKYLVAVQPIPTNDVKKQCTGKVNLDKPLHLVIGSLTPTSVLLSWGTFVKTPYEGNIMNDCLEDGYYTIRYRERNRKWNYQTCPTSDTVIDNLKPNTPYEFGIRSNKDDRSGGWSKPVIHNTNMGDKNMQKPFKPSKPVKPVMAGPHTVFPPRVALHNRTQARLPAHKPGFPVAPKTSFAPPMSRQETVPSLNPNEPQWPQFALGKGTLRSPASSLPTKPNNSIFTVTSRNMTSPGRTPFSPFTNGMRNPSFPRGNGSAKISMRPGANGEHHKGFALHKPAMWPRIRMANNTLLEDIKPRSSIADRFYGSPVRTPMNIKTNLVGKPGGIDKTNDVKQSDKTTFLQPNVIPAVTAKPAKQERRTTTASPAVNANNFETWENSSVFSSLPASEVDAMGKKRFIAPHVVYKTDKKPDEPCSITTSLTYFPDDEPGEQNVTAPPKTAPSNLTVVTVEGCPSFVILDWEKTDNDTTEYEVISTTKGPDGEQVSILTTDKTHTAVENLRPESSYEFKVKPKNDLGEGPPSEPVSFSTESADPRVSENVSGKDAIWTQFPFKTDSFSECNGKQYVKRTWYRKFVGIQLCNSLRYKIYLSDSLNGKFYNIGDQTGHGEDHCQFVDSFLDGRTGTQVPAADLLARTGFYRAVRQEPVHFGMIGGNSHITYVSWYECGLPIPGKW